MGLFFNHDDIYPRKYKRFLRHLIKLNYKVFKTSEVIWLLDHFCKKNESISICDHIVVKNFASIGIFAIRSLSPSASCANKYREDSLKFLANGMPLVYVICSGNSTFFQEQIPNSLVYHASDLMAYDKRDGLRYFRFEKDLIKFFMAHAQEKKLEG